MYSSYQDREEFEDDLYNVGEGDSEGSQDDSELEFQLYSQLHYSAHLEDTEADEGKSENNQQQDVDKEADVQQSLSNVDLLHEHLQIRAVERNKRKKNNLLREQKPFVFEEVIVIDSGPDITISEEDDASVCAAKGQRLPRVQTSTPSQEKLDVPEVVDLCSSNSDSDSSDSDSDSSDSDTDSSDSDSLENWMILGRGKEDGDQSISLNLDNNRDATSDDNTEEEERQSTWVVSSKDRDARIFNKERRAQIIGQRDSKRYYSAKHVRCRNCDKTGHLSKSCPKPKKMSPCFLCGTSGHLSSECPNKHCSNCGLPGHVFNSCSEKPYWHKQCHRCGMKGHFFDACPEIWRQYHVTTKVGPPVKHAEENRDHTSGYCYNCSRKGHYGHDCVQTRMFKGTFPTIPLISYYDSVDDTKRREVRVQMKVKQLKKNGILTEYSKAALTPEPPRKRLKVHQSKASPQQSSRQSKQKSGHIFFSDDHNFEMHEPPTGSGSVKPWRPASKIQRYSHGKLHIDEAADFPRGGERHRGNTKNNVKKQRKDPRRDSGNGKPGHLRWSQAGEMKKVKNDKRNPKGRFAGKKAAGLREPSGDNLFCIKQRKPKKRQF
ncbi:zinc finger CCHC domain-containing protein 7-like isoform X2 [Synchiropus splendidus]|uniref:zinc finger CCHC domain-containing protein 7-like isoform X2 n=1 Tax=Synchiropus splendidus TaxID=270530 RepID=UPI00237D7D89|nr:zinc finger CCHC domain-containing protein 7-like isoform X2 [Synchiropus splendidus]